MLEQWQLATLLVMDPSSRLHAKVSGWVYAPSPVERALYEQIDMQLWLATAPKSRNQLKPLSRPWVAPEKTPAPVLTKQTRTRLRGWADRVLGRV